MYEPLKYILAGNSAKLIKVLKEKEEKTDRGCTFGE